MATSIYAKPIKAKTILKFTLPTVLMMVFMSLYTVVDGIVVANCVGSDALSAINIVYPFTLVFMAVGLMFSTGSNAIIAKKMGEGKQEEANRLMSGVAITATVISVIIAVLFTIFAEPMYMMFGSNEKILPYCIDYGSVMIPYGFVMCWQMLNQSYLVTADKPHIMLVFSILSGCTNIVLDILFMAVWDFGIIGAGLGTIIGMAVGAIPLLLFFNKKQTLHFGKPEFKVSEILFAMANGSSEAVTNLSTAVTTALFNIQMMHFAGAKGVAAISAILYIHFIFTAVSFGFTSGVSPVISFNYGAQNHEKLQKLFKLCIKITLIISVAMITASEFFAEPLVGIFSAGNEKNSADCTQRIQNFCNKLSVVRNEYFRIGTFHRTQQRQDFSRNFSCKNACFRVCRNADFADVYRHKRCMVGIARCRIVCSCNFRNIYNCQCKEISFGKSLIYSDT